MPRISPLRGVRYAEAAGDPGELLAPPYDVIDPGEARDLRDRSPYNAVRLVLPRGEDPGRYERSARRLRDWLRDGLLVRDDEPALYLYAQTFRRGGRELTRHGIFCALGVSPFGAGEVLPHEETHRGPKADRLALMRACGAQLSPVFLVAPDPGDRLRARADRGRRGPPLLDGATPEGIRHRLWRMDEGPLAEDLRSAAGERPLLIADGHHRYETALEMARGRSDDDPARRTLACIVGASDPGLLCLPTHRALARPPAGPRERGDERAAPERGGDGPVGSGWRAFLEEGFEMRELGDVDAAAAARAAAGAGAGAMALVAGGRPGVLLLPREADRRDGREGTAAGARSAEDPAGDGRGRKGSDGSVPAAPAPVHFDRRILRRGYGLGPDPAVERGLLSYHRAPEAAVRAAGEGGAAFLLPPPDVEAVWAAARRGERLPPKSTYFWPKLPSGVLFRLLDA